MPNYKVGDILKPIDGSKCNEYSSFESFEAPAAIRITKITSDGGYGYDILDKEGNIVSVCDYCFKDANLTPATKTLNTLQVGDYMKSKDGGYKRLLAVLNRSAEDAFCMYVMSTYGEKDSEDTSISDGAWNVLELKKYGYSIEDPTPEAENTEAQIAAEKRILLEELAATIRKSELDGEDVSAILSMIQDLKKRV